MASAIQILNPEAYQASTIHMGAGKYLVRSKSDLLVRPLLIGRL